MKFVVSPVAFGDSRQELRLDGKAVAAIYADLKPNSGAGSSSDLTAASPLPENEGVSFFGLCLAGPFVVDATKARNWMRLPNPNGRSNAEVLTPIWNGKDVTDRNSDRWAVDFGGEMDEADAVLFEAPFGYATANILPSRASNNRASRARWWFRHGETRPGMRRALLR